MPQSMGSPGLLLVFLMVFIFVQRWLHAELQAVLLILTRSSQLSIGIFSLLLFPGVVLHEGSHYLTARLLGVKTGRFSIIPSIVPGGKLRLGYVETARADLFRDTLIGIAPLISGSIVVAYLGIYPLGFSPMVIQFFNGDFLTIWNSLKDVPGIPDFWLWFYLAFTVSSTMLPSSSDRRSWLPLSLFIGILAFIFILAGVGGMVFDIFFPWLTLILDSLLMVMAISLGLHLVLAFPFSLIRMVLSH
jgi:hypothetical protein